MRAEKPRLFWLEHLSHPAKNIGLFTFLFTKIALCQIAIGEIEALRTSEKGQFADPGTAAMAHLRYNGGLTFAPEKRRCCTNNRKP